MTKYAPLGDFLKHVGASRVPMTFAEIERVIGAPLPPKSQNIRAWWSNNQSNNVMTKVWRAAGYRSEQVDLAGRKLVFVRDEKSSQPPRQTVERHPLLGALKGMINVAPGVDLTEPADPEWGKLAYGDE